MGQGNLIYSLQEKLLVLGTSKLWGTHVLFPPASLLKHILRLEVGLQTDLGGINSIEIDLVFIL